MIILKCYLSEESINALNNLIMKMFKGNSICDNLVYNLQYKGFYDAAKIFHEKVAHEYPVWSDKISEEMDKLGAKAERRSFEGDTKVYDDVIDIFREFVAVLENTRQDVLATMDYLDYDINNKEICLMLEDLVREVLDKLYMVNKVLDYAEFYNNKEKLTQYDFKVDDVMDD